VGGRGVLKEVEVDGVGMDDDVEGTEDGGFREIFEGCGWETEKGRRRCIHHSFITQGTTPF